MSLTEYVIMPGIDYQEICNAVRAKTGREDLLKSSEIAPIVRSFSSGFPSLVPGDTPIKVSLDVGGNYKNTMQDMGVSIVVPMSGQYRIKCFVRHGYTSETAWDKTFSAQFYQNGMSVGDVFTVPTGKGIWISVDLDCVTGDEIRLYGLAAANSSSYYLIATSLMLCIDWNNNFTIDINPRLYSISVDGTTSSGTISVSYGSNTYTSGDTFRINSGDDIIATINTTASKKHTFKLNGTTVEENASSTSTSYTYTPTNHATINFSYGSSTGYVCDLVE